MAREGPMLIRDYWWTETSTNLEKVQVPWWKRRIQNGFLRHSTGRERAHRDRGMAHSSVRFRRMWEDLA